VYEGERKKERMKEREKEKEKEGVLKNGLIDWRVALAN
jgi:hypothetical protein